MSRAFTREIDDAPPPPLPERPVPAGANPVTPRGAQLIADEIEALHARLQHASALESAALNRDLRYWSARRASMDVIAPDPHPTIVGFGTTVTLRRNGRTMRLTIVGEDEADPSRGLIAWTAPLARALEGAEIGDEVEVQAGASSDDVEILSLSSAVVAGG